MNDDFNTPEALAEIFHVCKEINRRLDADEDVSQQANRLTAVNGLMGIVQDDAVLWFQSGAADADWIEALIVERNEARTNRDFARADAIRDELAAKGIVLEDGAHGTSWKQE
jgi:cysteinyl-tRNA synthetase